MKENLPFIEKAGKWAQTHSLGVFVTPWSCCGDEFTTVCGAKYDLDRFGINWVSDPRKADVLIVLGFQSPELLGELEKIYQEMLHPKWVIAVGACACSGGLFHTEGVGKRLPVDLYIPGCPPRPESIIHGIIQLQERIYGS